MDLYSEPDNEPGRHAGIQSLGPCTLGWIDPNEAAEEGVRDTKARSTTFWCLLLRFVFSPFDTT